MTTQTPSTNKKPLFKRIKPLGWVLIALVAVSVVSLIAVVARPLTSSVRALPTGAAALAAAPTITPYVKPTSTVAPTQTPLPGGWTQGRGLNGQTVFVPPEDVQTQIIDTFSAVVACGHAEDADDNVLKESQDISILCAEADQFSAWPSGHSPRVRMNNAREINSFGPVNPITCSDFTTCTVARAKIGLAGMLLYTEESCKGLGSVPCVYRGIVNGIELHEIFIITITKQEDGTWKATDWKSEKLPGPPPSP